MSTTEQHPKIRSSEAGSLGTFVVTQPGWLRDLIYSERALWPFTKTQIHECNRAAELVGADPVYAFNWRNILPVGTVLKLPRPDGAEQSAATEPAPDDGRYANVPPACTDGCCAVNDPEACAHIFVRKITEVDALVHPAKRAVDDVNRSSQEELAPKAHDKRLRCTVCRLLFRDEYNLKRHMKCATHKSAVAAALRRSAPDTATTTPVDATMAPLDSSPSAAAVPVSMAAPPPVAAAGAATYPPVARGPDGSKRDLAKGYTENGSSFDCLFCDRSFPLRSSVLNHLRSHGIPPKRHTSPQDDVSSDDGAFVPSGGEDGKNYNNRRSNRLDCKQFDVELHATVGTLRRMIMDVYGSMPTDQDLVFNDTVLTDPMATLASYGIEIGSTVDFSVKTTDLLFEAGFEGTSLVGT